jgi:hypothetical protein
VLPLPVKVLAVVLAATANGIADPMDFCPASVHRGEDGQVLTLFPPQGNTIDIPLPPESKALRIVASAKGKTLFASSTLPLGQNHLVRFDFKPTRQAVVNGATGFGQIWGLTLSSTSDKLYVYGSFKTDAAWECGAFEIDPTAGSQRPLHIGKNCGGGGGGPVSPDGTRIVSYQGKQLTIVDLDTGATQIVRGVSAGAFSGGTWISDCAWSPDGRWVAAVRDGKIVLIDATNVAHHRSLGSAGDAPVVWSPDSKYLLFRKSQPSCALTFYFESLESLEVQTGKRGTVKSSHCEVSADWYGWVDPPAVQ